MRKLYLFVFFAVLSTGALVSNQSASALSSDPNQLIGANNTFFAYVKAGEKISAEFIRSSYNQGAFPADDITVTISGVGVKEQKCVLKRDGAVGKGCSFAPKKVEQSGIWKISFAPGSKARPHDEASSNVLWVSNLYSWNITIRNGNDEQKGRVWADSYAFRQPPGEQYTSDFTTYYISQDGYIYKAVHHGYNGQISILSADSVGIRNSDECMSAYQSALVENESLSPALGACGSRYKLFFEEPSGSLPEESVFADKTKEWIKPTIQKPEIGELHFVADNTKDQLSGDITFFLRNFIGQYQIKIDADNDGSFDGQNDVALFAQIKELSSKLQKVHFQGVNKQGQIIFPSQTIGIKVEITKVAEIHFVASDVEGRDGLELIRLNGANAPNDRLCWNDTELDPIKNSAFATMELDGRSCPVSAGGVHGWTYSGESWGNARYIDDWTYATAKIDGNNEIIYPEDADTNKDNEQQGLMPIFVGLVAVIVVIAGAGVAIVVRKKSKGRGTSENPPSQQPPTGQPPVPPPSI